MLATQTLSDYFLCFCWHTQKCLNLGLNKGHVVQLSTGRGIIQACIGRVWAPERNQPRESLQENWARYVEWDLSPLVLCCYQWLSWWISAYILTRSLLPSSYSCTHQWWILFSGDQAGSEKIRLAALYGFEFPRADWSFVRWKFLWTYIVLREWCL